MSKSYAQKPEAEAPAPEAPAASAPTLQDTLGNAAILEMARAEADAAEATHAPLLAQLQSVSQALGDSPELASRWNRLVETFAAHDRLEEGRLFPAIRAGDPSLAGPLAQVLAEHEAMRARAAGLRADGSAPEVLTEALDALEEHAGLEDQAFLPLQREIG